MHHRFDDSPDDYDMDMDQRTRMLGRGGRIILLGDGTEILAGAGHDGDGDVDMDDRVHEVDDDSCEDRDEEAVQRNRQAQENGEDRSQREGTPAPASSDLSQRAEESKERLAGQSEHMPEDPSTKQAADNTLPDKLVSTPSKATK